MFIASHFLYLCISFGAASAGVQQRIHSAVHNCKVKCVRSEETERHPPQCVYLQIGAPFTRRIPFVFDNCASWATKMYCLSSARAHPSQKHAPPRRTYTFKDANIRIISLLNANKTAAAAATLAIVNRHETPRKVCTAVCLLFEPANPKTHLMVMAASAAVSVFIYFFPSSPSSSFTLLSFWFAFTQ